MYERRKCSRQEKQKAPSRDQNHPVVTLCREKEK